MINAEFSAKPKLGFKISGHAGFAEHGEDIVCAAVSSSVMMCINALTEVLALNPSLKIEESLISCFLEGTPPKSAEDFLKALEIHLNMLAEDYPGTIKLTKVEV